MQVFKQKLIAETEPFVHVHVEIEYSEKKFEIENELNKKKLQLFLKRVFDITVSGLLIILLSPLLLVIALIIKLTSKGSVLYSNERMAYKRGTFKCHKFRSMVSNHAVKEQDHKLHWKINRKAFFTKCKTIAA